MIDLHCHVLPGVDDGPGTMQEAVALARVAQANGIRTLVATPHVSATHANGAEGIARAVAQVRDVLAQEGVAVQLAAGGRSRSAGPPTWTTTSWPACAWAAARGCCSNAR